jgi:thioredoxin-like negative regulator of GroEL
MEPIFIMFKLQGCKGCLALEPVFSQLANSDRRVSYGIVDLSEHKSIAQMSDSSTTQIKKVPAFIIYAQGRPKARFISPEKNLNAFMEFISNTLPTLYQQPQTQMIPQQQQPQQQGFVQNMYGGNANTGQQYNPDMGNAPKAVNKMMQGGAHPTAMSAHPSMKQCDPDDAECLAIPHDVIPHNTPWEDKFRQLNV